MAVLSCRDYLRKNENTPIIMIHNHVFRHTYVFIIAARYGAHFPTATKTREKVPGTLLKLFRFPWSLAYLSKTSGGVSPISETDVARSVAGENFKAPSSLKRILRFAMSNRNK